MVTDWPAVKALPKVKAVDSATEAVPWVVTLLMPDRPLSLFNVKPLLAPVLPVSMIL